MDKKTKSFFSFGSRDAEKEEEKKESQRETERDESKTIMTETSAHEAGLELAEVRKSLFLFFQLRDSFQSKNFFSHILVLLLHLINSIIIII